MEACFRILIRSSVVLLLFSFLQVVFLVDLVSADMLDTPLSRKELKGYQQLNDCEKYSNRKEEYYKSYSSADQVDNNRGEEGIEIIATYSDASGAIQTSAVKSKDLSASWIWENTAEKNHNERKIGQASEDSFEYDMNRSEGITERQYAKGDIQYQPKTAINPVKLKRQKMRQERRKLRTAKLINLNEETEKQMQAAAIERSKHLNTTLRGKYSVWRNEYESPHSNTMLKLMMDQNIMAKAYATIARSKNDLALFDSLMEHIKESQFVIGEANSDAELHPDALDRAKAMGRILSIAKNQLYDFAVVARKLRAMLQSTERNINELKRKSAFLIQLAAKTVPKPLHCLPLQLTTDYFLRDHGSEVVNKKKLEDPSLYHYAIFSDNVLATSVVVNSTALHAKEPENHVFHIVTDKLNFAAMKMWFLVNSPVDASVQVENIDDFKWLNSSYCSVLRQLESARIKEFYFKANHPSSLSAGSDNLKYRNPKYLSMLNHLRFYLPEVYPKLDKILFLDDDIVVQKDLTPLWSIDLQGMVNGAVETCKESFHRFDKYLNFSNPKISKNFDPNACGWAFGMNIFDLKEWKKRDITGIYHHWQDMNEDRTLWKLGSLPPGLITFYNLTYPLDRNWHVLGLGYDPALNQTEMENAAVIHYNGNYKPWLNLAVTKYRSYWSKYIQFDNPYLRLCNINE
ncbi:hypothetical protein NE237_022114 [Protea cynaroides]|uniref:Hexosyltransferase n=1 Tax=Protea cynaroides TaxID=273540 RepID=A0A9Q0HAC6_9MAGN|nr:hypothetical protein NE237_022114 [Protea cynaroides]